MKTLEEITARMEEIRSLMEEEGADLNALNTEMDELLEARKALLEEAEARQALANKVAAGLVGTPASTPAPAAPSAEETRANAFRETGRLEVRTLLGSGTIAKPSRVGGISGLAEVASGIVDDVNAIALTGNGSWIAAYKATDAAAAAVTDGQTIGGTASTYNYVTISPAEWGILDAISNQVKKFTSLDYMSAIENSALIALRAYASTQIVNAITSSSLKQAKTYALNADYLRNLVLGFRSIEGKGPVCLYIAAADLATLGAVRGTNEKAALYSFAFDAGSTTSGVISEGGLAIRFRVLDQLTPGTQLFGQPGTVDMPMWDNYQISTDEGGEYFQKNLIGIRGLQTANADLVAKYGMQVVTNPS